MLTLRNIMNPNKRMENVSHSLYADCDVYDVNSEDISNIRDEYINVVDENGNILGAIKTERVKYLVSKRKMTAQIQVLDALDVGIIIIDSESRIYYVNNAYSQIVGVNVAKIIGRYLKVIEPDAVLLKVLENGKPVKENILIKSVNKYVSTDIHPIFENGEIVGAYSLFKDVTQINFLHYEVKRITQVAEEFNRQINENDFLKSNSIIGESKAFKDCIVRASKVAATDATVLIRGENGSGKEIVARMIQKGSKRSDRPFITVNCSAIPESLIESELFGYEEGSFTGAAKGGKMGKFQLADGGTLFLDEIGDLPLPMQAKLLRVLQEGEIEKVGRIDNIPIDVRVIAATNRPIEKMVLEEKFRQDLYYRLNVITVNVPALKDRGNDSLILADYFLHKYNERYSKNLKISPSVYQAFMKYHWPGNVRELQNAVESAVILSEDEIIELVDIPEEIGNTIANEKKELKKQEDSLIFMEIYGKTLKEQVDIFENEVIQRTLKNNNGNKEITLKQLGISRRTFYRKCAEFDTK